MERSWTDDEADRLRAILVGQPAGGTFKDALYQRVADVMGQGGGSDLDLAVLVRHLVRRWRLIPAYSDEVSVSLDVSARLRRSADQVGLREVSPGQWVARPWEPHWQKFDIGRHPDRPDDAAAPGSRWSTPDGDRELPAADPFFLASTGFNTYRTPGQRAACRAVVSAKPGSTIIAMLPTGSGKTEVALSLADSRRASATLIVVPTVALAYDFERRFREHYAPRMVRGDPSQLKFAWTGDTQEDVREQMRSRVLSGKQPLLVTSPESMTRALRNTLAEAAARGRLAGFVVDEAHLVTHWGRSFRPEFRMLADLRRDLLSRVGEYDAPVTLLLSATLGSYEIADLHELFSDPGPCALIAANALRAEPEMWIGSTEDAEERKRWVLDAVDHLPRPLALYVTRPEEATTWARWLRDHGYGQQRVRVVTGQTGGTERQAVLTGLRAGVDGSPPTVDLVVATSAFGLGIDYPHLRSVVHACLPETVDRWYQEIGRGGRDGEPSAAVLLTHLPADIKEADSLGVTLLTPRKAHKRWRNLWEHRIRLGTGDSRAISAFLDLEEHSGFSREGSYNRRWNAHLVQGLVELKVLRRRLAYIEDTRDLPPAAPGRTRDWVAVEVVRTDHEELEFWEEHWEPWRQKQMARSGAMLGTMAELARKTMPACTAIANYYEPGEEPYRLFGHAADTAAIAERCGRCPGCRAGGVRRAAEPHPAPRHSWPVATGFVADLDDLAAAAAAADGLIVLHDPYPDSVAAELAGALLARGVRHFSGVGVPETGTAATIFVDPEPISPGDLTPCSSFVGYLNDRRVPASWLIARLRRSARHPFGPERVYDVLLVRTGASIGNRAVGRDIGALDASTALHVLGGRA
ncbi:protein DpdF [Micromonospora cathayae]|uniref:Protein DpdF n=1 Tax=Micromonospora cathayae TaxID=3028804 RepID=A0ABY7ZRM3_9ACTN|nr:protein DpdF [Micromonospora sp. HUAS 3]WDZ84713.1 protein DpdF [Micromonospora sp. HUAS 3]